MNKYEQAFKNISVVSENSNYDDQNLIAIDLHTLRELVDKATPKKPINFSKGCETKAGSRILTNHYFGKCPNCEKDVWDEDIYCNDCGQILEWK